MDIKPRWRPAYAVLLPPPASTIGGLVARHLGSTRAATLGLAALVGLIVLVAIAICEHAKTRRAELPYRAEIEIAKAEAKDRRRYARAQTRLLKPLVGGEQYRPDTATSLVEIKRTTRGSMATNPRAFSASPDPVPAPASTTPPRAPRGARPNVRRPKAAA